MIVTLEPEGPTQPYIARYKGLSARGNTHMEAITRLFTKIGYEAQA